MTELSGLEARERIRERAPGRQHDAQERAVIGDGEALIGRRRIRLLDRGNSGAVDAVPEFHRLGCRRRHAC